MASIIPLDSLNLEPAKRISTGEILGILGDISSVGELKKLQIDFEILPSGHRSAPAHSHSEKEECMYVLEGSPKISLGGDVVQLKPGEFVTIPPCKTPHMIFNDSSNEVKLLVISTGHENDIVTYV